MNMLIYALISLHIFILKTNKKKSRDLFPILCMFILSLLIHKTHLSVFDSSNSLSRLLKVHRY